MVVATEGATMTGVRMLDKVYKLARWLPTWRPSYRRQTRRVSANLRRAA